MSNLSKALRTEYPDDIEKICQSKIHSGLTRFTDIEIEMLWKRFSASRCAGWLNVHDYTLNEFYDWLEE